MGKREEEGYLVVLNVLFSRIDQLSLVVLYSTTNLHECRSAERSQEAEKAHTFGITKSASNFEKT